jgi:hypothetical protein
LGVVFGRGGEVGIGVYEFVGRAVGISISTFIRAERVEEEGIDALLGLHDCIVYAFAGDGEQGSDTGALGGEGWVVGDKAVRGLGEIEGEGEDVFLSPISIDDSAVCVPIFGMNLSLSSRSRR